MADAGCDLVRLLPEVQEALCDLFDTVDCSLNAGPDLSLPPFNLNFRNLGKQVTYLPDNALLDDFDRTGLHEIPLGKTSTVFSDDCEAFAMEVAVMRGRDWQSALRAVFDRNFGPKWTFFVAESERGRAAFHVLSAGQATVSAKRKEDTPDSVDPSSSSATDSTTSEASDYSLWIVPVTRIFAIPPPVKKVKVVKRVIKKKSPSGEVIVDGERKVTRVVKKKVVKPEGATDGDDTSASAASLKTASASASASASVAATASSASLALNGRLNGSSSSSPSSSTISAKAPAEIPPKPTELPNEKQTNGGSAAQAPDVGLYQSKSNGNGVAAALAAAEAATASLAAASASVNATHLLRLLNGRNGRHHNDVVDSDLDDDLEAEDIAARLRAEIRERQSRAGAENGGGGMGESLLRRTSSSKSPSRHLNPILEGGPGGSSRMRLPDVLVQDISRVSRVPNLPSLPPRNGHHQLDRNSSSSRLSPFNGVGGHLTTDTPIAAPIISPGNGDIPVHALQLVLRTAFTFEELGHLRIVHPHWDEMCGQLLNNGYYALLERTDQLLMRLQRRAITDSGLHHPVAILTNIQVHILNPVDIMRAALDEGICCFPYGLIIDRTSALVDAVERMTSVDGEQHDIPWEPVAVLAQRASMHYRSELECIMEERMGTCVRLKAAQRIIRMDSMIVEASVNKLEKDSAKVRDEFKWELDQVQAVNQQLRRENRQIKAEQMRLEARIESLEQKLRTISRLLT